MILSRSGQVGVPHEEALHRLGRLYQRLEPQSRSRTRLSTCLRLNPALPSTLNNLAVLRMAVLDYPSADHLAFGRAGFAWDPTA